jgi:isocitrate/isopropylmalate dehydrogenase
MKMSDGLFLVPAGRQPLPDIDYNERIVDNCMQLVTRPAQFDVLVMENFTATSSRT